MTEENKDLKSSVEELTKDQVATLYNLLHSGIQIPARLAGEYVRLQDWVTRMTKKHGIKLEKEDK